MRETTFTSPGSHVSRRGRHSQSTHHSPQGAALCQMPCVSAPLSSVQAGDDGKNSDSNDILWMVTHVAGSMTIELHSSINQVIVYG